ncbi:MAG: serine hydroxymethyltransferase, partial [Candidatus Portnoybacteria bacterium CG_4_9_14_3_um_filter_44_9]
MNSNRNWEQLKENDFDVYKAIIGEEKRQARGIELIPSENYTWP